MIAVAGILIILVLVIIYIVIRFNREVKEAAEMPLIGRPQEELVAKSAEKAQQRVAGVMKDVGRLMEILLELENKKGRGLTQAEFVKVAPKPIREELIKRGLMYRHDNHYLVRRRLFSKQESDEVEE